MSDRPPDPQDVEEAVKRYERRSASHRFTVILLVLLVILLFCNFLSYCWPPGYS